MKKYIIFFTMLFFASACCKKGVTTYITDPEMISVGSFKVGTYYIYKDSTTSIEDSVWVTSNISSIIPVNAELLGKNYNRKCEDLFETVALKMKTINNKYGEYQISNKGIRFFNYPIPELILKLPFKIGEIPSSTFILNKNIQFYPSYNLNGINYDKVYQIESKVFIDNTNDTTFGTTFFSTTTGLLKYSIKNDTSFHVYELVRSQIVK